MGAERCLRRPGKRILLQLKYLHDEVPIHDNPTRIKGIDLDARAHPFPERHDQRSARVRALLCVMLRKSTFKSDGMTVTADSMAKKCWNEDLTL